MTSRDLSVVARRRYRASRETVFRAFTDPNYLTSWFSPSDEIVTEVLKWDLREGGDYRLGFGFPGGHRNHVLGKFREISRPGKLVFTWTWEEPDPHAGTETRVTIELVGHGQETEVTVTHERFPNQETRARHDEGWKGALDRLAAFLGERKSGVLN